MAAPAKDTTGRRALALFAPYRGRRKVTIFGSARTATDDPLYLQARTVAEHLAVNGWMVVTGAGPGIMQAAMEGAGRDQSIGVSIRNLPPNMVAVQLKILIPVGIPTSIEDAAKNVLDQAVIPTANMWWAQTPRLINPIAITAATIAGRPNSGLRENTGTTSDKMANAGKIRM